MGSDRSSVERGGCSHNCCKIRDPNMCSLEKKVFKNLDQSFIEGPAILYLLPGIKNMINNN